MKKIPPLFFLMVASAVWNGSCLASQAPSQWRGPDRDGHFPTAEPLLKSWPEDGPELILSVESIGDGYSSPMLDNGNIYTTGMIDKQDFLTVIASDGTIKWQKPYGESWTGGFPDTRSSPVVDGDCVYVQSGLGKVTCFNKSDGDEIWSFNVDETFETEYHVWGNSETPLILDELLICTPGGKKASVVALNKRTGELVWTSDPVPGARSYVSATTFEHAGKLFVLAVTGKEILAVDPSNGAIAWRYNMYDLREWKWQKNGLILTNTPTVKDDCIFISKGYDFPAVMLELNADGTAVEAKFIDETFDNHHHGLVLNDGYLYGSNWENNKKGRWVCMEWDTGEITYESEWDTKGITVMADGMLYCYNERGNIGLVKPDPSGFEVVSQFKIKQGKGPHWCHPTISEDGKLLIRHGDVLMVYNIRAS